MKAYFGANGSEVGYIREYKEKHLISLKQIGFDPFNWEERWEIKEKDLSFIIKMGRELTSSGIEMVYINQIEVRYKGISTYLGRNVYNTIGISSGHDEIIKFFRLLTNYLSNLPKKEVKK